MLFNSLEFAVFLPIVFALYWFVFNRTIRGQNALIVGASYYFYGCWDWRFLFLIAFSTLVDFSVGRALGREERPGRRKLLLWVSLVVNLGLLGFFKYFNFFVESFVDTFTLLGVPFEATTLNIILPVGISFYTFQTLSYTIDVYRRKLEPTSDLVAFSAFVSFFPQLVAGPIERATHLLPQFYRERNFDYALAVDGCRQILWGLIKKVVIADNCAQYANMVFDNPDAYGASTLVLGAVFFAFQIYGDFSGYSDIAIGVSRLFGFDLMQNFAYPYFSRDVAEFWRRWHISLSTWFRDYLYIPLGGSRGGTWMRVRNTFIIFLVSGFWHGAAWTFVIWGFLNALYFLPLLLTGNNRSNLDVVAADRTLPTLTEVLQMGLTFALTCLAWIFFRAESVGDAFHYVTSLFDTSLFSKPAKLPKKELVLVAIFFVIEWAGRRDRFALETLGLGWNKWVRRGFYYVLALAALLLAGRQAEFIYFQF